MALPSLALDAGDWAVEVVDLGCGCEGIHAKEGQVKALQTLSAE